MDDNLQSEIKDPSSAMNSIPDQVSPIDLGVTLDNRAASKAWHPTITMNTRLQLVQKLLQAMCPATDLSTMQDESVIAYVRRAENYIFEIANSRGEYFLLLAEKIYKIQKEFKEMHRRGEEMQMQQPIGNELGPVFTTPPAVEESKDSSNEKEKFKRMQMEKQLQLIEIKNIIHKIPACLKKIREKQSAHLSSTSGFTTDGEKAKNEIKEATAQIETFASKLVQMKRTLEEIVLFVMEKRARLQSSKQTPSEIVNSITDCDQVNMSRADERRCRIRKEVSDYRRYNQLRAANLNRGLGMDVDGATSSDHTFNLRSLEEALPPVSHFKRAPRMKMSLKLQDIVMNSMKDNRLLRLSGSGLGSMDNTATGENS